MSTCVSFDFNTKDFTCWLQTTKKENYDNVDVDQYIKTDCVTMPTTLSTCGITYDIRAASQSYNGIEVPAAKTLVDCQAACTSVNTNKSF